MSTPERLVHNGVRRYGRFDDRVRVTNPADAYRGLSRLWHRFRLKKWLGFALIHPEMSGAMIIQDVTYLASSDLFLRDGTTGRLVEKRAVFPGGGVTLPEDLRHGGCCAAERRGYRLRYDFTGEGATVQFACAATRRGPAITGELRLHRTDAAPPLSISAKITPTIDYYTYKQPLPAEGTITAGEQRYVFRPDRDFAIVDEHRSYFPYSTNWTWGTFATRTAGGVIGANFVDRTELGDADDESSTWVPGRVEPLAGIDFQFRSGELDSIARVRDHDGRLDVTFTPAGRKDVKVNLLVGGIDYTQLSGVYAGTVTARAGESFRIDGAPGVLERMTTRF